MTLIDYFIIEILIVIIVGLLMILIHYPLPSREYYKFKDGKVYQCECTKGSILVNCNIIPLNTAFFESYTLLEIRDNLYLVEKDYNKSLLKSGDFILCERSFGSVLAKIIDSGKKRDGENIDFVVREVNDLSDYSLNNCYNHSFTATTDKERCCSIIGKVLINKRVKYYGKKNLSNKRKS